MSTDPEDARYDHVSIDDWDAVEEHLRRFADTGRVDTAGERVVAELDNSRFSVARDGEVSAGMPLHDFDAVVDELRFDHDGGAIVVRGDDFDYEFRRP
ncbi:hypothetical protein [Halomicrococcus sp. NG-SE-24]|uniref:hypothetical protein n=1 Tax=Halomicrococcus sp. NG-SE-24 TaxID=3436928 RepID=UPI003D984BE7